MVDLLNLIIDLVQFGDDSSSSFVNDYFKRNLSNNLGQLKDLSAMVIQIENATNGTFNQDLLNLTIHSNKKNKSFLKSNRPSVSVQSKTSILSLHSISDRQKPDQQRAAGEFYVKLMNIFFLNFNLI
jgi:hypothetical protein